MQSILNGLAISRVKSKNNDKKKQLCSSESNDRFQRSSVVPDMRHLLSSETQREQLCTIKYPKNKTKQNTSTKNTTYLTNCLQSPTKTFSFSFKLSGSFCWPGHFIWFMGDVCCLWEELPPFVTPPWANF